MDSQEIQNLNRELLEFANHEWTQQYQSGEVERTYRVGGEYVFTNKTDGLSNCLKRLWPLLVKRYGAYQFKVNEMPGWEGQTVYRCYLVSDTKTCVGESAALEIAFCKASLGVIRKWNRQDGEKEVTQ